MNINAFKAWLSAERPTHKRDNQDIVARAKRVEREMGNLEDAYRRDKCAGIISQLTYTRQNYAAGVHPAHPIAINGNAYTGTLSLKRAVEIFVEFMNVTR